MTINQLRRRLYQTAKYAGDVQAVTSPRKGAIMRRIMRRIVGKVLGRAMGRLFR